LTNLFGPKQEICDAIKAQPSSSYHPLFQAGFLLTPSHFSTEDVTTAAAAAMHPLAASAGAISASLIRSALFQRGSSCSTSFSISAKDHAEGCPAPLDLLLAMHGAGGCAGQEGCVVGVLGYSSDVFDAQMMELLVQHFEVSFVGGVKGARMMLRSPLQHAGMNPAVLLEAGMASTPHLQQW
jgi:hypothetical protein